MRPFHAPVEDDARGGALLVQNAFGRLQVGKQPAVGRMQVCVADNPIGVMHLSLGVLDASDASLRVQDARCGRVCEEGVSLGCFKCSLLWL